MGSVTHWIHDVKEGDSGAARFLWERYFPRLLRLARKMLRGTPRRAADEEDVALSAFDSFCRRARQGQFSQLGDRDDLWRLLVVLTTRKAFTLARHERRRKRGGAGAGEPSPPAPTRELTLEECEQLLDPEPTPAFAAQFADECSWRLQALEDAGLRAVALWKLEGYTNDEIAARLGCALRTVERKLRVIRAIWTDQDEP